MPSSNAVPQNYFATSLTAPLTSVDTTVYLNLLPTASEGWLELDEGTNSKEIIYYTSKGSNFVTCPDVGTGRGVGGTTAVSHTTGAVVKMKLNAEWWKAFQDGSSIANNAIAARALATSAIKLGYAEITSNFTTSSGSLVDVTGLTTTFTVPAGGRDVLVIVDCTIQNTNAGNSSTLSLVTDGTVVQSKFGNNPVLNGNLSFALIKRLAAPSAGSHTYKAQVATSAGTLTVIASNTPSASLPGPASITVLAI